MASGDDLPPYPAGIVDTRGTRVMNLPYRSAARAFLVAMVATLVADAVLSTLTRLVDVTGAGAGTPWWVAAHVVERGRWVVLALLLVAASGRAGAASDAAPDDVHAWRTVGLAVVAVPLLWIAATWLVQAVLFTAAGRWDVDGRVFLAADYYRGLFIAYAPTLLGGLTTLGVSRHVA